MASKAARSRYKLPLYAYIGSLFFGLLLMAAAVVILIDYRQATQLVLADAAILFAENGEETHHSIEHAYGQAMLAADLMATGRLAGARTLDERMKSLPFALEVLRADPDISAAYIGYDSGEVFLVRRAGPHLVLASEAQKPPGTAFIVQSRAFDANGHIDSRLFFYREDGTALGDVAAPDYEYDPRNRPWYAAAQKDDGVQAVLPYVFYSTREIGASFVRRSPDHAAVAAIDVTLGGLSEALTRVRPTPAAAMMIMDDEGEVVALPEGVTPVLSPGTVRPHIPHPEDIQQPALQVLGRLLLDRGEVGSATHEIDGAPWQAYTARFDMPGKPLYFAMAVPQEVLLGPTRRMRNLGILIAALVVLPLAPLAMAVSQIASRPLLALTRDAQRIRQLKFDRMATRRSSIAEIDTLANAMTAMKTTIRQFLEIGAALAGERHFGPLLSRLLTETAGVAGARGGAVYLAEPDGRLSSAVATLDGLPLGRVDLDPAADAAHPAMRAASAGQSLRLPISRIADWYPGLDPVTPLAALAVPLRDRQNELVGVLELFLDRDRFTEADENDIIALVEAVSGSAAVAIESQRLIEEQRRLLAAVIELIAGAIDAKSPYTGGHCQRVPVLARMIAARAAESMEGPFAAFSLNEAQWEELHLAAWLHDCGKLMTPEYVVDKATKLETIGDRLHEIRMRFELVKREAEVACWKAVADGGEREALLAALAVSWAEIDDDFAFIAACNQGGEALGADRVARIRRIAERRWTRTLDDRIGLSFEEVQRKAKVPAQPLPAEEKLLDDRPDHLIERNERQRVDADNPWGIRMEVPEHLYNRGEVYNLVVERGTLTPEERFKINEHVIDTIRMLAALPLPRHLRNAIEIAGGHHERIDGTGYPKRLTGDEMSIPARIMAVADVFEALTASDRPYKRRLHLSEAVAILARMRDEGHIDAELFRLFLETGVYRDYAMHYLHPDQIDQVEIEAYLAPLNRVRTKPEILQA